MRVYSGCIPHRQTWKQLRCPSNKLWYIHSIEHYSAVKGNELATPKTHEGTLNAYGFVKEADRKKL